MSNLSIVQNQEVPGSLKVQTMDDLSRMSKMLSQSGYFTDAKDAAQCGVKVLAGLEMGIGAFASMTGIHIIQGKPSVGANLMASAVKRHPNYNYRVAKHTDTECQIDFYEKWNGKLEKTGESVFTIKQANEAKVWSKKKNSWVPLTENNPNWKSYPKNMLFARAMSNGIRWHCPDVFDGTAVYTPEELNEPEPAHTPESQTVEVIEPITGSKDFGEDEELLINAKQLKLLMATATNNEWSKAARHLMLAEEFNIDSVKKLLSHQVDEMLAILESEDARRSYEAEAFIASEQADALSQPIRETEFLASEPH